MSPTSSFITRTHTHVNNTPAVLMEIQSTLHEPPRAVTSMRRAIQSGMASSLVFYVAVSVAGYAALGDAVPGDILTAFSQPASVVTAANVMVLLHMLPAYQACVPMCLRDQRC